MRAGAEDIRQLGTVFAIKFHWFLPVERVLFLPGCSECACVLWEFAYADGRGLRCCETATPDPGCWTPPYVTHDICCLGKAFPGRGTAEWTGCWFAGFTAETCCNPRFGPQGPRSC